VALKFGGEQLGNALRAMGSAIKGEAGIMHSMAGVSTTRGGYERRKDDWKQQLALASKELDQIDKQILGAQIRLDIQIQKSQTRNYRSKMQKLLMISCIASLRTLICSVG
jgi:hypothetical protein